MASTALTPEKTAPPVYRGVHVTPSSVTRIVPFPTANPLFGATIWMPARFDGVADPVAGRAFGQPAGAAVDDVVAGAVLAVVLTAPALLSPEPDEQPAPSTTAATRRIRSLGMHLIMA
jgi:hypothetical protein